MDTPSSDRIKPKRPTGRRQTPANAGRKGSLDPARRPPGLGPSTTSEQAFAMIALRCLDCMVLHEEATLLGDPVALHRIRIAITCLRAAVSFFSLMVAGQEWKRLKRELKWLNRSLSAARDLDVVVERLQTRGEAGSSARGLAVLRSESHARVARAVRSSRYRKLIESSSAWVRSGPWRNGSENSSMSVRAGPISIYASRRLKRWHKRIIRKSGDLAAMDAETRHQLRIRTKRVRYATEWFGEFLPGSTPERRRALLKQLRRAQNSLGELNDAERANALVGATGKRTQTRHDDAKQGKHLLRKAQAAFNALAQLERAD
jgi:CHAD domain-containing protein